jgi:hypothetical protein
VSSARAEIARLTGVAPAAVLPFVSDIDARDAAPRSTLSVKIQFWERGAKNGSSDRSILEIAVVPNVVDLTLVSRARRILRGVLEERGLGFFLVASSRVPKLDPRRIAWVVEAARRRVGRRARNDPNALSRTRRVLRRELIRLLSDAMVQAGL